MDRVEEERGTRSTKGLWLEQMMEPLLKERQTVQ